MGNSPLVFHNFQLRAAVLILLFGHDYGMLFRKLRE